MNMGIERKDISWPLFYSDDLVLCGESEEDLRVLIGHLFLSIYRNGYEGKYRYMSKVMVLGGEE